MTAKNRLNAARSATIAAVTAALGFPGANTPSPANAFEKAASAALRSRAVWPKPIADKSPTTTFVNGGIACASSAPVVRSVTDASLRFAMCGSTNT